MVITEQADATSKSGPGSGRRPGRPTLSNEELLDAALDLFLENGFERTSIEAITAAAGMAKRTVYARYGDKETLFRAALTRAIDEWIIPVERLRAAETEDLEQTLLDIGRILLANVLSPGGQRLLRLTNAMSGRMPELGAFNVQKGTEPTLAYLADLFRRRLGADTAEMPEADDAAQAFLDLVVGGPASSSGWGVQIDAASLDRHTRYRIRLFLHGLLPEDSRTRAAEEESRRLTALAEEALIGLDRVRDGLQQIHRSAMD